MTSEWAEAVERENLVALERMIDEGADIDARDGHGQTALMNAARNGHTALVRLLVRRGAALEYAAKHGLTALMLAVLNRREDVVRILAEAGADPTRRATGTAAFAGKSALDLASEIEHQPMVEILHRTARTPESPQRSAPPPAPAAGAAASRGINVQQVARWVVLLAALVVALYLCWRIIQPFANVLLWAVVLAIVFAPVHRRIEASLDKPWLSAAISTVLVILTIVGPVSFVTVAVVAELRSVALSMDDTGPWLDPNAPLVGPLVTWIGQYVDLAEIQSEEFVRARLETWSGILANSTLGLVGGVASAAIQMVLVVFTLYYLFRDGARIRRAGFDVIPIDRAKARDVVDRTKEVVGASVYGVISIAAIQGTLGFFIFWLLGLPSPLLWGVVMFVFCMIPMAGAFLVWVPAAIYLALTGAWVKAIILTLWGMLVVGSIDNFLSPRLIGRSTRMHELLIFFGVLGGLDTFGVIGVILGPVVIAITLALLEIVRQARPADETMAEPGIAGRQVS